MRVFRLRIFAVLALSCFMGGNNVWQPSQTSSSSTTSSLAMAEVMRPYNLDYLDIDTMNYYLQAPKSDYDLAVLFYAQWCNNCHAFAPLWDQIARLLKAGSKESKLILALFDCEHDAAHMEVCNQAGVKHYPTIMFYSLSGQVFHRKQRKTKRNPYPTPQHGITYNGDWMLGDAVYDWVRTMSGLSAWHRAGWGRKLRAMFLGKKGGASEQDSALPLGIPNVGGGAAASTLSSSSASISSAAATGSSASDSVAVKLLENKLSETEAFAVRKDTMLNAVLFPATASTHMWARVLADPTLMETTRYQRPGGDGETKNYTDAFLFLNKTGGWTTSTTSSDKSSAASATSASLVENEDLVLRSCVMELSLEYCTRVSTHVTLDWIASNEDKLNDEATLETLESDLLRDIEAQEPYCVLIESCIQQSMNAEECRPKTCPYTDPAACRYMSSCFEMEMQRDYAKVLQVATTVTTADDAKAALDDAAAAAADADATKTTTTTKAGGGGWGF